MARPERACLSEAEVAEALIAVVEVEASTVAAAATTTSEGAAAAAAAISGAAAVAVAAISEAAAEAEEDLVEGAVVEALINSKIKGLRNVSSY